MSVIYYITWVILVADCLLLILLILAQESKSQGLGGLGGGMDMSFGGHTQRKVKRLTTACAVIFGLSIIGIIIMMPNVKTSGGSLPSGATPEVTEPVIPEATPVISVAPAPVNTGNAPATAPVPQTPAGL